jgi:hypothetical protein
VEAELTGAVELESLAPLLLGGVVDESSLYDFLDIPRVSSEPADFSVADEGKRSPKKPAKPSQEELSSEGEPASEKLRPFERILKTGQKPRKSSVGGDLRALEEVLTQCAPGEVEFSPGLEKRATAAVRFLFTIPDVERAMVMVKSGTGLKALATGGVEDVSDPIKLAPIGILRSVFSTKGSQRLLDASKDSRFFCAPAVKERGIRSLLCVHFVDPEGVEGLLYADSLSKPGVFSASQKSRVDEFVRRLATEGMLETEQRQPPGSQEVHVETRPVSPWVPAIGLLLALILVLPALLNPPSTSPPLPVHNPQETRKKAVPSAVLYSFARSLGSRNFKGAYSMLSEDRKAEFTEEQFQRRMSPLFSQHGLSTQFASVTVKFRSQSHENQISFTLQPPDRNLEPWEAVTERRDGVWYVSRLKGEPSLP